MASAMSTLRLDNYVYTEEGIRAAWQRVAPGGHLSLAISVFSGHWFFERLYWTVAKATGREPRAMYSPLHGNVITFIVPADGAVLDERELAKRPRVAVEVPVFEGSPDHFAELGKMLDAIGLERTAITVVPSTDRNPISKDAAERKAAVDYLKYCTDCTADPVPSNPVAVNVTGP